MSETTVLAILSLIGTIVTPVLSVLVSSSLTNYRVGRLEEEVRKHNQVVERTYRLEESTHIQDEQIKTLKERFDKLEGEHEKCVLKCVGEID